MARQKLPIFAWWCIQRPNWLYKDEIFFNERLLFHIENYDWIKAKTTIYFCSWTYLISSKAFRAFLSSSFIVNKSRILASIAKKRHNIRTTYVLCSMYCRWVLKRLSKVITHFLGYLSKPVTDFSENSWVSKRMIDLEYDKKTFILHIFGCFRTRKIMSSTWTRPDLPISMDFCVMSVMNSITKSSRNSTVSV